MNWMQKITQRIMPKEMPLITDESGKPRSFYHGTNENFENFEHRPGKRYVLFSEFDVNTPGHFFAEDPDDAREYGRNVLERNLDVNRLLLDPNVYPHMGVDKFPPELEKDLEYILEPLIIRDPEKGDWLDVGVSSYPAKEGWIYYVIGTEGLLWDALDNPEVVNRMKELGYDGTYVDENEPGKRSIFVLDNKQIYPVKS